MRAVESLLPAEPLAQLTVLLSSLEPSAAAQLSRSWEPQAPRPLEEELAPLTQRGVELPRRERLLLLWRECFS